MGADGQSRIARALARQRPDLVRALVITPPVPLSLELIDGKPAAEDEIAAPTVVLWPGHDRLFPVERAGEVRAFLA